MEGRTCTNEYHESYFHTRAASNARILDASGSREPKARGHEITLETGSGIVGLRYSSSFVYEDAQRGTLHSNLLIETTGRIPVPRARIS